MSVIGTVESLWRYPVKSMRGEELENVFVGAGGVQGDRLFAFKSSAAREDFPWFTARQQHQMLQYRPRFRQTDSVNGHELTVDVETTSGERLAIDSPALMASLREGVDPRHQLSLLHSERALADCQPISLISLQTAGELGALSSIPPDKRRFRANIYVDLVSAEPFAEDDLVGRSLRIGSDVVVSVVERDSRCLMITLDPDTATPAPGLLKTVAQFRGGNAGVYATVLLEGTVRKGDSIEVLE